MCLLMLCFGELAKISHHGAIFVFEIFPNKLLQIARWLIPNCICQQDHSSRGDKSAVGGILQLPWFWQREELTGWGLRNLLRMQLAVMSMAIYLLVLAWVPGPVPIPRYGKEMRRKQNSRPEARGGPGGRPGRGAELAQRRVVIGHFGSSN